MRPLMNWMSVTQANAPMSAAKSTQTSFFRSICFICCPSQSIFGYTVKVYHK